MAAITEINNLMEKLSNERKNMIYMLTLDMLSAQQAEEFDDFTPDDIKNIQDARKRIADGDCLSFTSPEEFVGFFTN